MSHEGIEKKSHTQRRVFAVIVGGFFLLLVFMNTVLVVQMAFFKIPQIQKSIQEVRDVTEQTLYRVSAQAQRSR
ncbi:MAG: hypothetical protein A3H59_01250 [Candidatus Jacksonbacteria bacterium RIFCSPLOWO2_02_FULL_43_9]|nr:MAG: hypothetical protein UV70_C0012G0009 [Parcubacteria group bacterium GW2011_GWA2_43_13]OGY72183.1 MAG: hypothetical protein A3H59_01250 [Candidatus Jacksonbacteria bacterium RIFCSPLOWO2_02_FULL_43_9]